MTQDNLTFLILGTLVSQISVPDGGLVADVCLYAETADPEI